MRKFVWILVAFALAGCSTSKRVQKQTAEKRVESVVAESKAEQVQETTVTIGEIGTLEQSIEFIGESPEDSITIETVATEQGQRMTVKGSGKLVLRHSEAQTTESKVKTSESVKETNTDIKTNELERVRSYDKEVERQPYPWWWLLFLILLLIIFWGVNKYIQKRL